MKKLVLTVAGCLLASVAVFAQARQLNPAGRQDSLLQEKHQSMSPRHRQDTLPHQKWDKTRQNNESTYPERSNEQKSLPHHKRRPVMDQENRTHRAPSDTTRHGRRDTSLSVGHR